MYIRGYQTPVDSVCQTTAPTDVRFHQYPCSAQNKSYTLLLHLDAIAKTAPESTSSSQESAIVPPFAAGDTITTEG